MQSRSVTRFFDAVSDEGRWLEFDKAAAGINYEREIAALHAAVEALSARDDRRGGSNDRAEFDRQCAPRPARARFRGVK